MYRDDAPLFYIIMIPSQSVFAIDSWSCVLSGKAANTNFIVFSLTRPVLEPKIYCTRGEHTNDYTTDPVIYFWTIYILLYCIYLYTNHHQNQCLYLLLRLAATSLKPSVYLVYCNIMNMLRRVWRYQRGNQNLYIEEQTTQWPKEKGQTTIYKTYT